MESRHYLALLVLAHAATAVGAQPLEDRLVDCAGVEEEAQRLACYDNLAAPLRASDKDAFGLEHKTPEPVAEIEARVSAIGRDALGKMVFTLDNGQTWQQKDSKRLIVHEGDAVTIERGALSAFYLSAGDNKRISVSRIK